MSKRRLFVTLLIFALGIALIIGTSYLVSLLLKQNEHDNSVNAITAQVPDLMNINTVQNNYIND